MSLKRKAGPAPAQMAFARARALLCLSLIATSAALSYQPIDDEWLSFLDTPPAEAASLADSLGAYAAALVDELLNSTTPLALVGELDVVVSGGGFYDAYYLGVSMVRSRGSRDGRAARNGIQRSEANPALARAKRQGRTKYEKLTLNSSA